jgi:hypothetical protein
MGEVRLAKNIMQFTEANPPRAQVTQHEWDINKGFRQLASKMGMTYSNVFYKGSAKVNTPRASHPASWSGKVGGTVAMGRRKADTAEAYTLKLSNSCFTFPIKTN